MNKKTMRILIIVGILIIMGISLAIYQQLRTTTYEEILPNSITENKDIEQVTIRYCNPDENAENDKTMALKEESDITKIVKESKDMKLKKTSEEYKNLYLLEFKITNELPRLVVINQQDTLTISGSLKTKDHYQIKGPNKLVEIIESNEAKWESISKDAASIESGSLHQLCP